MPSSSEPVTNGTTRLLTRSASAALLLAALLLAGVSAWPLMATVLLPEPFVYTHLPYRVLNNPVVAGGWSRHEISRCNNDGAALIYSYTRQLVNADTQVMFTLPPGLSSMDPGCHTIISVVQVVPADTPPGRYYLRGVVAVQGRWRSMNVPYYSEMFGVVAP